MSEVRVDVYEEPGEQAGSSTDSGSSASGEAPTPDLHGLQLAGYSSSADVCPSPSEASGLLSLPWEIVSQIASHLPAQCVINVLPKVCRTLGVLAKDSTAWQARARKVIGSRAGFPVGPKKDFDWPTACLEMEHLVTCWTGEAHREAKQIQKDEEEREQAAEGQGDDGVDEVAGVGEVAQEVAYGVNEGMEVAMDGEDDEVQHILGGDQVAGLNTMQHQPQEIPSPPAALECITLPSGHIANVNSVLLLGGEGTVCATASRDWNVKLWDLQAGSSGTVLHTLMGQRDFSAHRGWVWCLASRGPLLASGGFDSTVRLWDLQASGADRGLIRAGAAVLCLSCQADVLLAGTFDKRVTMYDTRAAEPLVKSLRLHGNAVMCLAADDRYIISGSKDCTVAVYDRRADKDLTKLQLNSYLLSMSYSGSEIWAGDNTGRLHSFSMQEGSLKPLSQFDVGHTALITGIHRSSGSLYTCSSDCTVKVHVPCAPPRTLRTLRHRTGVHGLSVEAGVLAVAFGDIGVEVWRPRK